MFAKETYIERRNQLKKLMKSGVIIIPGNPEAPTTYLDNCYHFQQDSSFLYYFGVNSPNLVGIIDIDNNKDYIFGREYTIDDIVWTGQVETFTEKARKVGIENFEEKSTLKEFLKDRKNIHFTNQYRAENILYLAELLDISTEDVQTKFSKDLVLNIISMRNIKTEEEIREMEKATNVTREMHLEAMRTVKPGMKAYELVANIERITKKYNAFPSFYTICTVNGQVLHNHLHHDEIKEGDLVLLDCGARLENGYCGDMTTVFPVSKKFTERQKDIYSLLIEMFEKAEEIVKPGVTYKEVHLEVCKVLTEGLKKRGFLKGDTEEIIKAGAHAMFFPHGLGHMIGLDVHDMENLGEDLVGYELGDVRSTQFGLKSLRLARELKEGFVLTIEPGIYFIPELMEKWQRENINTEFINFEKAFEYADFGGMRYEGDFLVTANGNRRLGDKMPKYFNEVEEIMAEGK